MNPARFTLLSRFTLALLLSLALHQSALAQARKADQIVKLDNSAIEAAINEIDETSVSYRRFSNPTGPVYRIAKSEIKYILYANGEMEKFSELKTTPAVASKKSPPAAGKKAPVDAPTRTVAETAPAEKFASAEPRRQAAPSNPLSVSVGAGLSLLSTSGGGTSVASDPLLSFRAGVSKTFSLFSFIALMPTLEIARMGGVVDVGSIKYTTSVFYGQLSLPILFRTPDRGGIRFFGGAGPYLAVAALGTRSDGENSVAMKFSKDEDGLQRLHFGIGGQAGVGLPRMPLSVYGYYTLSLSNLAYANGVGNATLSLNSFGAGIRYDLGRR